MSDQQGWGPPQQPPWEQAQQPSGAPPWQQPYAGPQWQQPGPQPNRAPQWQQPPGGPPPWQGQAHGGAPWQQQPYPGQQPPQPGGPQYLVPNTGGRRGGRGGPPKKSHRVRNILLGTIAGVIVLFVAAGVIGAATGAGKKNTGAKRPITTATHKPKKPAAPVYTAAENAYYKATIAAYAPISGGTEQQIVNAGNQLCKAREDGTSQPSIVSATGPKLGKLAKPYVLATEKALCPSQIPVPPQVLLNMSGSGIQNSAPFLVSSSQVTVTYSFNCSSFGGSGNFQADLLYGNQSSPNSDDQSIANQLAPSGQATTTVYPQDPGNNYYVSVNSECNWTIEVVSP
jgi:hypothetical protein